MLFIPSDLFEKLEFDKVLELVSKYSYGLPAKKEILEIQPISNKKRINQMLKQVAEYKLGLEESDAFPMANYSSLVEVFKNLSVIGFVLTTENLQAINSSLRIMDGIINFFTTTRQETYKHLYEIIQNFEFDPTLLKAINKIIDEEGNFKSDASPELELIRRRQQSKTREIDKLFKIVIQKYRTQGYLADTVESFRNGRRVLSVKAENKRKIRGIIHDESATGKTAFIEPEVVISVNNDIFNLEALEKREIYRILKEISDTLRPYIPNLTQIEHILIEYDIVQSKAQLAMQYDGQKPVVKESPTLGFKNAFHPLLLLKNKKEDKKTVPFDLTLHHPNRVLVLSGPNAGGKSITMKSVGLLQLMLQSGMLIPVDELSELGIFKKFFADIGDQQSLEDDLSTYSSRLKNMNLFLKDSDKESLIIIDEFGSGTDPKIGGAIAEAILRQLNYNKVYGIVTTHYSNLKLFAFKNKGILNGSMTFDKSTLSPTYELKVGRPGSSYAFEIANKSGLPKEVLDYAKHKTGKNEKAIDELLVDLQKEKAELVEKLTGLEAQNKKFDKLIKSYEYLNTDLEYKRKRLKMEQKQQNMQQIQKENKDLEKLVREIKESKNLEKAKELAAKKRKERRQLTEELTEIHQKVMQTQVVSTRPIKVGDFVKLRTGSASGKVESIKKDKVIVQMGLMKMTVDIRELHLANEPLSINSKKSINMDVKSSAKFESKIDIRGMHLDEAIATLESFIDKALMTNVNSVNIIHGKGTGSLRRAVIQKIREYTGISNYFHPQREDGGDGVTIVEFI